MFLWEFQIFPQRRRLKCGRKELVPAKPGFCGDNRPAAQPSKHGSWLEAPWVVGRMHLGTTVRRLSRSYVPPYPAPCAQMAYDRPGHISHCFRMEKLDSQIPAVKGAPGNQDDLICSTNGWIFSTEYGPAGGDELNLIIEGANYDWPDVSLGIGYESLDRDRKNVGRHDAYQAPIFAWLPSQGVSSLFEIRGFNARWNGDLLVGSLKGQSFFGFAWTASASCTQNQYSLVNGFGVLLNWKMERSLCGLTTYCCCS